MATNLVFACTTRNDEENVWNGKGEGGMRRAARVAVAVIATLPTDVDACPDRGVVLFFYSSRTTRPVVPYLFIFPITPRTRQRGQPFNFFCKKLFF